jgi:hypothetical protein
MVPAAYLVLELPLDPTLFNHSAHRPQSCAGSRVRSQPKQRRQQQPEQPANHQDDPNGVDAEPRGVHVHGEGQYRAEHTQEQTKADPTWYLLSDAQVRPTPPSADCYNAEGTVPGSQPLHGTAAIRTSDTGRLGYIRFGDPLPGAIGTLGIQVAETAPPLAT